MPDVHIQLNPPKSVRRAEEWSSTIDGIRATLAKSLTRRPKKKKQSVNILIQRYQKEKDSGVYKYDQRLELYRLSMILQRGGLSKPQWKWLSDRYRDVYHRTYKSKATEKPSLSQQLDITNLKVLDEIKSILKIN